MLSSAPQTFRAVSDVLRAQGEALRKVEDESDSHKVSVEAALRRVGEAQRVTETLLASRASHDDLAAAHKVREEVTAGLAVAPPLADTRA